MLWLPAVLLYSLLSAPFISPVRIIYFFQVFPPKIENTFPMAENNAAALSPDPDTGNPFLFTSL